MSVTLKIYSINEITVVSSKVSLQPISKQHILRDCTEKKFKFVLSQLRFNLIYQLKKHEIVDKFIKNKLYKRQTQINLSFLKFF